MDPNKPRRGGRARGVPSTSQHPQRPGPGSSRGAPYPPQPQQPWSRGPAPQGPPQAWSRHPTPVAQSSQQQASSSHLGRGVRQERGEVEHSVSIVGSGEAGDNGARGGGNSVRGRIVRVDTLNTKPSNINSKKGTSGQPINLTANYFQLLHAAKWCLYQYRVDFAPEIDNTSQKKYLMRTAIKDVVKGGGYLFDGTVLYTPQRLNPDPLELFAAKDDGENIRLTIRLVGDVSGADYHYFQLFNIIVKKCLILMGFQLIGRNYFNPSNKIMINDYKIQLWPGYITSMRQHEQNILLNVDLQFKFMRMDTVFDMLHECQGANMRKEFQSKVIGSIVLTYYNNKTYRIDDVDFNSSPNSTFQMSDGTEISYVKYFGQKYNVRVTEPNQPMLVSRSKPREIRSGMPETVYLVPELCQMTGLTDKQRDNFQLMRTLADHTRVGAEGRIRKLIEFSQRLQTKPEVIQEIKRWDLAVADRLIQFAGRVLPQETILSGDNAKSMSGREANWTKEIRAKPALHPGRMNQLVIITPSKFKNATYDFLKCLERTAGGMRWSIGRPEVRDIHDDRVGTYLEAIERAINQLNPTLVMVVLPNQTIDRYSACKKKLSVDRGVPSQFIVTRNLTSKGVMSIATKVAIQMNCKIGGSPWSVIMPLSNIMIVGYDVCRDTANKKRSFAGIVCSLDKQITRYFSISTEHKMEEELSENFGACLLLALKKYHEYNNQYPTKIIIYRDGVGDGQIPYVYNHEIVEIKKKLTENIYKNNDLQLAFIVVSKRINTRLFYNQNNPPPGTVVDDVITLPNRYDFFVVSQCVQQGTVSPTSFNVLEDNVNLPPDRMQMLTYKLCHLYYNWSGTVRVPAPCQYAHKLAFMTSQFLHRPAHPDLSTLLHYL